MQDPYTVLGVKKDAAAEDIKDHDQAEDGRDEIPHKTNGRIAENERLDTGGDNHGTADNHGTQDNGEG